MMKDEDYEKTVKLIFDCLRKMNKKQREQFMRGVIIKNGELNRGKRW